MAIEAKWTDFSNLDGTQVLAAAGRVLPKWIALLLVIGIAWQLARIIWMLIPGSTAGDPIELPAMQMGQNIDWPGQSQTNVQAIANAHLFGEASKDTEAPPPVVEQDNLAETRLSLSLKGTVAATDQRSSVAIIADQTNEDKVYVIGDSIMSGTSLHAVYRDRVVLNENGVLKELNLPRDFPTSAQPVRRNVASVTRASSNESSIQNVVAQNVTKLADVIRPTPYFVAGQQQGYRVYPGRDRKQFAALGLRPGDLIKDIDGAALTDPQQAMEIFQNLGSADQVSVTVERNGQPEVLVLKTSQLSLDEDQ
ncbi:MAG: type II secretion system protein GspC [Gammaproteobacteria bacterium]|nr:type II secretion system protein GspC [Gammaproteobacteria bacterium]MDH4315454.1 type II secretion system protein GspC [Gammaproteobacteria bacterium]MDH5214219.1 type II secretion system protein GspC [Gammaproteobacteria bacterium]